MPELPEVETIKGELEAVILGKRIVDVLVANPKVIRQPASSQFKQGLKGAKISKVLRKGKVLIFELSNGRSLVSHLKMTGQFVYPGDGKKSRVSFLFSDGKILDLNDQRLFAELRLMDNWRDFQFIRSLGPEPFEINVERFKKMLSAKKTKIKPLLMDQSFIAGVGNLYVAEALFRARIHPARTADSLSDKEKELLLKQIKETLKEAIHYKGSSLDQYVRLSGEAGGYVARHRVYARNGQPCKVCQTPIKRIALGGRGTFFCPKCQK